MTPNVLEAYQSQGYSINMGSPDNLFSRLVDIKEKRSTSCSGGCTISDAFVFTMISQCISPENIFVIGNSFGLSTFILADLFPNAQVDVIDAEVEGLDVQLGSNLTRKLATEKFSNVQLTVGYSPQHLATAMRAKKYNFFFVDGLHTNEQVLLDFEGILPFCDEKCVIYFHDVASCNLLDGWAKIKKIGHANGFKDYTLGFTQMGCTTLVRGYDTLNNYLDSAANDFSGPYKIGFKDGQLDYDYKRPWFWDLSFGHLERVIKRKFRKILGINQKTTN